MTMADKYNHGRREYRVEDDRVPIVMMRNQEDKGIQTVPELTPVPVKRDHGRAPKNKDSFMHICSST